MRRVLLLCLLAAAASAEDLGTIGPAYDIAERDLIEVIQDRLARMEKSGELARMQERYRRSVIDSIERPRPVAGIRQTRNPRTFYIDPTWTLERAVVDDRGRVLYPAGTKVNPLDYDRLGKILLFVDARSKRQLEYARRFMEKASMPVKLILVGGEPLRLMRELRRAVYYDQGGVLVRRLRIAQTPAIVTQEGRRIRVDEVVP